MNPSHSPPAPKVPRPPPPPQPQFFFPNPPNLPASPVSPTIDDDSDSDYSAPPSPTPALKLEPSEPPNPSDPHSSSPSSPRQPSSPVSCPLCTRVFPNRGRLHVHLRTHTNERPFACSQCPMRFRQKCHLARHLGTHNQRPLRPFACRVCDRRFRQASNCRAHEQRHLRSDSRINRRLNAKQRKKIDQIRPDYTDGAGPARVAVVDDRVDPSVVKMLNEPPATEVVLDGVKVDDLDGFVQAKWQKKWEKSLRVQATPVEAPPPPPLMSAPPPTPPRMPHPTIVTYHAPSMLPVTPAVSPVRRVASNESPPPTPPRSTEGLVPAATPPVKQQPMDNSKFDVAPMWLDLLTLSCLEDAFESEIESSCSSPSSSSPASSSTSVTFSSLESVPGDPATDPTDMSFVGLSANDLLAGMVTLPPPELDLGEAAEVELSESTDDLPSQQQTAHALSAMERWIAGGF